MFAALSIVGSIAYIVFVFHACHAEEKKRVEKHNREVVPVIGELFRDTYKPWWKNWH